MDFLKAFTFHLVVVLVAHAIAATISALHGLVTPHWPHLPWDTVLKLLMLLAH